MQVKDHVKGANFADYIFESKEHNAETGEFEGYLARFGEADSYRDVIKKGAFKKSIAEIATSGRALPVLWQHDTRKPIGVFTEIREDNKGLWVKGKLILKTQLGAEANELVAMGAITGMSIGFRTKQSDWDADEKIRTLTEIDLKEGSLVTFPAMENARIKKNEVKTIRELEIVLREAGFSRSQAKGIAARGFDGLEQRDAGEASISSGLDDLINKLKPKN